MTNDNQIDDISELLEPIVSEEGWRQPWYCPISRVLVHSVTGALERWNKDCGSWRCKPCAEERAREVLRGASRWFSEGHEQIWTGRFFHRGKTTLATLRKARQRAGRARAIWVKRDTALHVYCSADLSSSRVDLVSESAHWLSPPEALAALRDSLILPGVDKTRRIPGPPGRTRSSSGDWTDPLGKPVSPRVAKFLLEYVQARTGQGNVPDGENVDAATVTALVQQAYGEYRQQRTQGQ